MMDESKVQCSRCLKYYTILSMNIHRNKCKTRKIDTVGRTVPYKLKGSRILLGLGWSDENNKNKAEEFCNISEDFLKEEFKEIEQIHKINLDDNNNNNKNKISKISPVKISLCNYFAVAFVFLLGSTIIRRNNLLNNLIYEVELEIKDHGFSNLHNFKKDEIGEDSDFQDDSNFQDLIDLKNDKINEDSDFKDDSNFQDLIDLKNDKIGEDSEFQIHFNFQDLNNKKDYKFEKTTIISIDKILGRIGKISNKIKKMFPHNNAKNYNLFSSINELFYKTKIKKCDRGEHLFNREYVASRYIEKNIENVDKNSNNISMVEDNGFFSGLKRWYYGTTNKKCDKGEHLFNKECIDSSYVEKNANKNSNTLIITAEDNGFLSGLKRWYYGTTNKKCNKGEHLFNKKCVNS